jgi:uncharacterized protein YqgV (UPF0045/DUF77 family)
MNVSIDISMYPLHKDYESPIQDFIKRLRATKFNIVENPLSTQVYGDYLEVMEWINKNMHSSFLEEKHCVFILKIVNGDRGNYAPNF